MIKIKLKKTNLISFDKNPGLKCKIENQTYVEKTLGIKLPAKFSLFMNLAEKSEDGKHLLSIDGIKDSSKDVSKEINDLSVLLSRVNLLAEPLFQKLKSVNDSLKSEADLKSIISKYDNADKKYAQLDFMTHRNLLSDVIKSKKIEGINKVSAEYHIKSLVSAFSAFILEANKYAQGELLFQYPEKKTLLGFSNSKGETEYSELTQSLLNSYSDCAVKLDKYLTQLLG